MLGLCFLKEKRSSLIMYPPQTFRLNRPMPARVKSPVTSLYNVLRKSEDPISDVDCLDNDNVVNINQCASEFDSLAGSADAVAASKKLLKSSP